ncbi:hypothetical protein FCOIX_2035 [Fusarium coicis]|nr:hypothetical protein FCOIX_2035 [Fusarium coicis]
MLSCPSSPVQTPQATFLDLPLELRQQTYHDYFKVDGGGGYVYDGDSNKLVQAEGQPSSISLRCACRSVAEKTKSIPFQLNSITFSTLYRKDLQYQVVIYSNLVRFYTVLPSELLLRMRYFVTPEMFDQVDEVAPRYLQKIKSRISSCIQEDEYEDSEDDGSLFERENFQDVTEFDEMGCAVLLL